MPHPRPSLRSTAIELGIVSLALVLMLGVASAGNGAPSAALSLLPDDGAPSSAPSLLPDDGAPSLSRLPDPSEASPQTDQPAPDIRAGGHRSACILPRVRPALPDRSDAQLAGRPEGTLLLAEPGLDPRETPSLEGSPIEYVIITPPDSGMVWAWQQLADWKNALGHPALVITTEWIDQHYPTGMDRSERLRLFLRDAYLHWGLRWALLGGDADQVPVRLARSWFYNPSNSDEGTDVICETYYACLEGNWDADGDGILGEAYRTETQAGGPQIGDEVDFTPEIQVGRLSARGRAEVEAYLKKYFVYAQTPPPTRPGRPGLFLGEVLFHSQWSRNGRGPGIPDCNGGEECTVPPCRVDEVGQPICAWYDGATDCFEIEELLRDELSLAMPLDFLLERFEYWQTHPPIHFTQLEDFNSTIAGLSAGPQFVYHAGHGAADRWSVGDGVLTTGDLRLLTNGRQGRYFWSYTNTGYCGAIDQDCFGERLVLLPGHGAIGLMGWTNVSFPTSGRVWAADTYRAIYEEPGGTLGDGFSRALAENAPPPEYQVDYVARYSAFTSILLGEPGLEIWHDAPVPMALSFDHEPILDASPLTVTVTDRNGPVAGARVCVHKVGELYVVGMTGTLGTLDLPFWPQSTGTFQVGACAPGHRPRLDSGMVVAPASGSGLVLADPALIDDGSHGSAGNGNASIELGETVRLTLTVHSEGPAPWEGGVVRLQLGPEFPEGLIQLLDAQASLPALNPGESFTDPEAFLLSVSADPPPPAFPDVLTHLVHVPFDLILEPVVGQPTTRTLLLDVSRPYLHADINSWEAVPPPGVDRRRVWLGLCNAGQGLASHLRAELEAENPFVQVIGPAALPVAPIEPGGTAQAGPYLVEVLNEQLARLSLSVSDTLPSPESLVHTRVLDLDGPLAPPSLVAAGIPSGASVSWDPAEDPSGAGIAGYQVWYRLAEGGTWEIAHPGILREHRRFIAEDLEPVTRYAFTVRAIDAGGNPGALSETTMVSTTPPMSPGWPQSTPSPAPSSPLVCELGSPDASPAPGPLVREVVFGGDPVLAFHGDGSEVVDGDANPSTPGHFSSSGREVWARPAAGDIDHDGQPEVVAVTRQDSLVCWGSRGGTPRWSVGLSGLIAYNAPTLADLDADGLLEILVLDGDPSHGSLMAFNHDGSPWQYANPQGRLIDLLGRYLQQSPSVGDVLGDGQLEIVVTTREAPGQDGAVWVVCPDGSTLPGFGPLRFSELGLPGQGTTASPTLADVDSEPGEEIFAVTPGRIWCFNRDTNLLWYHDFTAPFTVEGLPEPVLGDIDGDGNDEVVVVTSSGEVLALRASDGTLLPGFPVQLESGSGTRYSSCIVANVDLDLRPDILFADREGVIRAYDGGGSLVRGFPISGPALSQWQSLAAWDVDGDGFQNLVAQGYDHATLAVYSFADVIFRPQDNPWPMRYRDPHGTGRQTGQSWIEREATPLITSLSEALDLELHRIESNPHLSGYPLQVHFALPGMSGVSVPTKVGVLDIQGRLVRSLVDRPLAAGPQLLTWDGRDARGRPVAAGVYLIRLEAPGHTVCQRLLMVR